MAFEKKTFAPDAVANARRLYEQTQTPLNEVAASLGITRCTLASRIVEWGWTPRKTAKAAKSARNKSTRAARSTKTKRAAPKRASSKRANPEHFQLRRNQPPPGRGRSEGEDCAALSTASENALKRAKTKPEKAGTVGASPAQQQREATGAEGLAVRVQRVVERELDAIDQILGAIGAADAAEAERSARTLASLARALKEVMRLAAPDEPADADDDDPVPRDLDEFRRELARRIEALAGGGAAKTSGDGG